MKGPARFRYLPYMVRPRTHLAFRQLVERLHGPWATGDARDYDQVVLTLRVAIDLAESGMASAAQLFVRQLARPA